MPKRTRDWDETLAKHLKDTKFVRELILASVEEGLSLKEVIGKIARTLGVKEFSKSVGMASPNLLRAISPKSNPTQETINKILKPFGLQITVGPITGKNKKSAA